MQIRAKYIIGHKGRYGALSCFVFRRLFCCEIVNETSISLEFIGQALGLLRDLVSNKVVSNLLVFTHMHKCPNLQEHSHAQKELEVKNDTVTLTEIFRSR